MSDDSGTGNRLLIVEDEAIIAMTMEDVLTEAGYVVTGIADNTATALQLVDEEQPDLVLCDVMLVNGNSGLDVAAQLAPRGIPCLFVTGNCPPVNVGRDIALGCLNKPFVSGRLTAAVAAAQALIRGRTPEHIPLGLTLYQ